MATQEVIKATGSRPVILTDLPNRVLNAISSNLSDRDLVRFAIVCTQLRDAVVSMYLGRVGFRYGETSLLIGGAFGGRYPFDVLKGTSLLYGNIGALDELDCEFSTNVVWELGKIRDLLVRLPEVKSLRLWFSGDTLRGTREDFMKALFELLNTLHDRSCTKLTILNLFLPAFFHPIDQDIRLQPVNSLRDIKLCMTTTYRCIPLLDWIILSINSSPVQKLHITSNQPSDCTVSTLLDCGVLPDLHELHVCPCPSIDRLVTFLDQHPFIAVLSAQFHDTFTTDLSLSSLPYLTKLVANPELVVWLLSSTTVPALQTVYLERSRYAFSTHSRRPNVDIMEAVGVISKFPTVCDLAFDMRGRRVYAGDPRPGLSQTIVPHIIRLTLFNGGEVMGLPECLGFQFPNLKILICDDDVYHMNTRRERVHFLRHMRRACPTLSSVSFSVQKAVQPISHWLGQDIPNI